MIGDLAYGIWATCSRTGVNASILGTYSGSIAFRIDQTFGTTGFIWISKEIGLTLTRTNTIQFTANGTRATRIRIARCTFLCNPFDGSFPNKLNAVRRIKLMKNTQPNNNYHKAHLKYTFYKRKPSLVRAIDIFISV